MPFLKEILPDLVKLTAIAGGAIAAYKAIHELREGTKQRHQELRWKRAKAAREMLHEIHVHQLASNAVTMLDWSEGQHDYTHGEITYKISYAEVMEALKKSPKQCKDPRDVFIRDCFDWFFYYLDRIEHAVQTGYIDFIDVESVFKPYAKRVNRDWAAFEKFLNFRDYSCGRQFFERYPRADTALPLAA